MRHPKQFRRELNIRQQHNLGGDFVVEILRHYSADEDEEFARALEKEPRFAGYKYCIVMPRGGRSLAATINREDVAKRADLVKPIAKQVRARSTLVVS
jgi:hypothetical protein